LWNESYINLSKRTYFLDRTNFFLILSALYVMVPPKHPSRYWRHSYQLGGVAAASVISVLGGKKKSGSLLDDISDLNLRLRSGRALLGIIWRERRFRVSDYGCQLNRSMQHHLIS
jgi:hypothetical protein